MRVNRRAVARRVGDPEGTARLLGMLAMCALPMVRGPFGWRPVRLEVEVRPPRWEVAGMIFVTDTAVEVVMRETTYVFPIRFPPRWRMVA
jgi:hypothetical protein